MQFSAHTLKTLHSRLILHRRMGGGPRTFPGGINKWQWKRMHEKKAREKERRLIEQEKQIYQARIRSQIRAQTVASENSVTDAEKPLENKTIYRPLTPEQHIKCLADRFMKKGAEDLWNEDDGPTEMPGNKPGQSHLIGQPTDLQNLIEKRSSSSSSEKIVPKIGNIFSRRSFYTCAGGSVNFLRDFGCSRTSIGFGLGRSYGDGILMGADSVLKLKHYSSVADVRTIPGRPDLSKNNQRSVIDNGSNSKEVSGIRGQSRWPRFQGNKMESSDDEDSDDDDAPPKSKSNVLGGRASLGKYDIKTKKRVPLNVVENYCLSEEVEAIREEVCLRRSMNEDERQDFEEQSILSTKRFDECNLSLLTVQALTEAGYVQMTRVQEATLAACLEGKDAIVKARAGTGKSIAFLLPTIETVLKTSIGNKSQRVPPIYVLIICPNRELASQVSAEANVLLKHHDGIGVQTLVGGTRFKVDQKRLESEPCQILVATPGRLLDHIENKSGMSVRLMGLQMLILDEADHLLNLGFRKDIEKIVDCLPRKRQSLLFSATIPKEVRRVSQLLLKREHEYIDTVGLGCLETNAMVKQFYLVIPHDQHFQVVHHLLKKHMSEVLDYKVVVFCATAMMTSLMSSLFHELKLNVREIHSKKPSLYRTRISDEFKESKGLILITSDISTRGMNYPDVSLVIQVGIPYNRGQYIHRIGRTGRQGKDGESLLLLAPWEQYFLDELKDLPLEKFPYANVDPGVKVKIEESMKKIDTSLKEAAYHAWLGYYNSITAIARDKTSLVGAANQFALSIGLDNPPALYRRTALKMGLKDVSGIRIRK